MIPRYFVIAFPHFIKSHHTYIILQAANLLRLQPPVSSLQPQQTNCFQQQNKFVTLPANPMQQVLQLATSLPPANQKQQTFQQHISSNDVLVSPPIFSESNRMQQQQPIYMQSQNIASANEYAQHQQQTTSTSSSPTYQQHQPNQFTVLQPGQNPSSPNAQQIMYVTASGDTENWSQSVHHDDNVVDVNLLVAMIQANADQLTEVKQQLNLIISKLDNRNGSDIALGNSPSTMLVRDEIFEPLRTVDEMIEFDKKLKSEPEFYSKWVSVIIICIR